MTAIGPWFFSDGHPLPREEEMVWMVWDPARDRPRPARVYRDDLGQVIVMTADDCGKTVTGPHRTFWWASAAGVRFTPGMCERCHNVLPVGERVTLDPDTPSIRFECPRCGRGCEHAVTEAAADRARENGARVRSSHLEATAEFARLDPGLWDIAAIALFAGEEQ